MSKLVHNIKSESPTISLAVAASDNLSSSSLSSPYSASHVCQIFRDRAVLGAVAMIIALSWKRELANPFQGEESGVCSVCIREAMITSSYAAVNDLRLINYFYELLLLIASINCCC